MSSTSSMGLLGRLPQEIKDSIYDQLGSPEHGFHHKDLVRASRDLHSDMFNRLLDNTQGLIKVCFNGPCLDRAFHAFGVPFLCEEQEQVINAGQNCMNLHIKFGPSGIYKDEYRLLMVRDLELFSLALQNVFFCRDPITHDLQVSNPDFPQDLWRFRPEDQGNTAMTFSFQACPPHLLQEQITLELRLLEHFRACITGQHRITLQQTHISMEQLRDFRQALCPEWMYLKAAAFSYLICLIKIKQIIEARWDKQDFEGVIRLSWYILDAWGTNMLNNTDLSLYVTKESQQPLLRICIIMMDICTCAFAAQLKRQCWAGMVIMAHTVRELNSFFSIQPNYPGRPYSVVPGQLVGHIGQKWCLLLMAAGTDGSSAFYRTFHDLVPITAEPSELYTHDAAIITALHVNGTAQATMEETFFADDIFQSLSINSLNIAGKAFRTEAAYDLELPEGCDGKSWVDSVHEARIAADVEAITTLDDATMLE